MRIKKNTYIKIAKNDTVGLPTNHLILIAARRTERLHKAKAMVGDRAWYGPNIR